MKTPPRLLRSKGAATLVLLSVSGQQAFAQHPLDSWVRRTVPTPNSALNSVAYGNGTFVAVGDNSFVARSTDGITWTTGTAGSYGTLRRVRFLNGQFVAVGASDKIIYSSDGGTWAANTLPGAVFWDVAWGNGVYVIAGFGSFPRAYVSSDGVNWTGTRPIAGTDFTGPWELQVDTIVFGNGGFLAFATTVGGHLFDGPRRFPPMESTGLKVELEIGARLLATAN